MTRGLGRAGWEDRTIWTVVFTILSVVDMGSMFGQRHGLFLHDKMLPWSWRYYATKFKACCKIHVNYGKIVVSPKVNSLVFKGNSIGWRSRFIKQKLLV